MKRRCLIKRVFILALGTALIVILILGGSRLWQSICGNYPISFYGRVVDANGRGLAGVKINFAILYSDFPVLPIMFGKVERKRMVSVVSDQSGDFQVTGQYGYSIRGESGSYQGKPTGAKAIGLKPDDDPAYGLLLDMKSDRAKLPDSPSKRVVYTLVNLN